MKRIFATIISVLLIGALSVQAQAPGARTRTATSTLNVDTLKNTDTIYHSFTAPTLNTNTTVQLEVSPVAGPLSGKAYIYGSITGNKYELVDSSAVFSLNDISASGYVKTWQYINAKYKYYRVVTYGIVSYIAAPVANAPTTATTGGTLAAATYYYKITALNANGETVGSNEVSQVTTGATSTVSLTWAAITGATSYKIYRGTAAAGENVYYTSGTNSFTDIGGANTAGTVPAANTAFITATSTPKLWGTFLPTYFSPL